MENELISVIVPCYNCEKYVSRCICSLLNQTYKDVEIIIVNDGSTDNTINILNSIESNRINIFTIENSGVSNARNYGLSKVKGKFVMFVDADDYIDNDYIEKMFYYMKKYDVSACISGYKEINNNSTKKITCLKLVDKIFVQDDIIEEYVSNIIFSHVWGTIFRREILENEFDTNLKYGEDFLFSILNLKNKKIILVNECGYNYVSNELSAINKNDMQSIERYIADNEYLFEKLKQNFPHNSRVINGKLLSKYNNVFVKMIKSNQYSFKEINEFIKSKLCYFHKDSKINIKNEQKINIIRLIFLKFKLISIYTIFNKILFIVRGRK